MKHTEESESGRYRGGGIGRAAGGTDDSGGGGGINVARAVTKLGGEATALFLAGGGSGDRLTELLEKEGVPSHRIPISRETRENLIIFEANTGQQFRFGMPGPEIGADEWERVLETLSKGEPSPQLLVASGSLPPGVPTDFYRRIAEVGGQRGSRVIVDTHGDVERLYESLRDKDTDSKP